MNMSITHSSDAASHEIPDSYAAIIAAYSQQSATSVECTHESLAPRIQDAVIVLPGGKICVRTMNDACVCEAAESEGPRCRKYSI